MRIISLKPDVFGAIASSLCYLHCLLTPIIFLTTSANSNLNSSTPIWWNELDFIFISISFFAIYKSTKTTSKRFMKYLLWFGWLLLFSLIINEKISLVSLPGYLKDISAIGLAVLHIYNLNYCQCKDENCCA